MSGRRMSHQLSSGMFVSGPPEQPKERQPTIGSRAVPYTGGDVRKSGELGKMFDIPVVMEGSNTTPTSRSRSHSGPLPRPSSGSGPQSRKTSGPLFQVPVTGLITSGPDRRSGGQQQQPAAAEQSPAVAGRKKAAPGGYGLAVTAVGHNGKYASGIPTVWYWIVSLTFVVGLGAGGFLWVVVARPVLLIVVAALGVLLGLLALWNWIMRSREVERFLTCYPNTPIDPRNLPIGKTVKITGHVTCGSIPLETSYQNVSRCIYASTELYEYRGWSGSPANPSHKHFTWGLRHSERHVADFYISDPNTGTRFLVRAGNGANVTSFVKPATILNVSKEDKDLSPDFISWLTEHKISSDDHVMRLEEGVRQLTETVMFILGQKNSNILVKRNSVYSCPNTEAYNNMVTIK
ncbi:putative membrane protein [Cocos nucifera]|uniref:Putative membrane protein n=1 Tax=Cocos nucifera TaxID=13894 RepID=A0A8K0HV56_COCNU|nr:putative membrane protein [Cocos nucifera]